ncbi:Riboflavin synthase eubacterial/eukaryotic [hydrothermal vent metagenome]|uniref:Riboflavin synthase n=1 Tax=hydrothermal vent metagenome TaxID=652676 RepID=A0A1W1BVP0_9ZZZZ
MFTGIIQAVGSIQEINNTSIFSFKGLDLKNCKVGDSIAVNGVCLTITNIKDGIWSADISQETKNCTTYKNAKVGDVVNFEKALRFNEGLDGHLVSGHIDDVAEVIGFKNIEDNKNLKIKLSEKLLKMVVDKGSITINGVSLTINKIEENVIDINLVPHTIKKTQFKFLKQGDLVNVEVDMIAKYVSKLINK